MFQVCAWRGMLLRGLPSHLCTAVYHPAARVRLMATSTGIMSATASLLAMTVLRIPLPACGAQGDRETVTHFRLGWGLTGRTPAACTGHGPALQQVFSAADCLVSVTTKMDLPWILPSCIFRGCLETSWCLCCVQEKLGLLTQYESNTPGKKCIWIFCCKVPHDAWKLHFLKWQRQAEVWASLRDCSHSGNYTSRTFEKLTTFPFGCIYTLLFPKAVC